LKVSEQIIQVLDALCDKLGIAIDWTAQNVIPYVEELCARYIRYEIVTSIVWIAFAFILFGLTIYLYIQISKHKEWGIEQYSYGVDNIGRVLIYVGMFVLSAIIGIIIMTQVFDIVTCLTLPEKTIIYELKYLLNS